MIWRKLITGCCNKNFVSFKVTQKPKWITILTILLNNCSSFILAFWEQWLIVFNELWAPFFPWEHINRFFSPGGVYLDSKKFYFIFYFFFLFAGLSIVRLWWKTWVRHWLRPFPSTMKTLMNHSSPVELVCVSRL